METLENISISYSDTSSASLGKAARNYRPDIDGLRAMAILSVVVFHAGSRLFSGGFVGVDIFFVISGYLIGSLIYREMRNGTFSFAKFYQRRAKRILPALFAVLCFCYFTVPLLLSPVEARDFSQNAIATILSFSNISFWLSTGYFSPVSDLNPLLMTWSLGVEEQFYIAVPILLLVLLVKFRDSRNFVILLALSAGSFGLSIFLVLTHPTAAFYLLPTRAWELGAGICLAVYEATHAGERHQGKAGLTNVFSSVGLGLLLYSMMMFTRNTAFPGAAAAFPVFGTVLIIIGRDSWINRYVLAAKPMVFIGLISYSWYLWHWPLLSFARLISERPITEGSAMAIVAASFGIAILSHRFIEQPFRQSSTAPAPLLRRYAMAVAAMLIPAILLLGTRGWWQRFPELARIEKNGTAVKTDKCLAPYGRTSLTLSPACVPTGPSDQAVALLGDSHAAALAGALRGAVEQEGFELYELTKMSCPPLSGVSRIMPNHPGHDSECAVYNQRVLDFIDRDKRVKVVVLAGFWSAPFAFKNDGERFVRTGQYKRRDTSDLDSQTNLRLGLSEEVRIIQMAGKHVVLVKDNPRFGFDPPQRLNAAFIPLRRVLARDLFATGQIESTTEAPMIGQSGDEVASAILDQVAAANHSIEVFDLKKSLCKGYTGCEYSDGRDLFYVDSQHLSLAGAERALAGLSLRW